MIVVAVLGVVYLIARQLVRSRVWDAFSSPSRW